MSFFVKEWRSHDFNHPTSIVHAWYKAFDYFGVKVDYSTCNVATLLQLPLHYLFKSYPSDHWLNRHRTFKANQFFIYDQDRRRLRIKVNREYNSKPTLCKTLRKDILERQTVKMQSFLSQYITNGIMDDTVLNFDSSTIVSQFKVHPLWLKYTSTNYRNSKILSAIPLSSTFLKYSGPFHCYFKLVPVGIG
jgi:hypothetical protein